MTRNWASALVVAVLLAGCGGGSSKKATTAATTANTSGAVTTAARTGGASSGPVIHGAKVRLVNLFAGDNGPATVEVDPGLTANQAGSHPVATVAYGQVSDGFEPPGSNKDTLFSLYQQGHVVDAERLIQITQTVTAGDSALIVLYGGDKNETGHITGTIQVFFLKGGQSSGSTTTTVSGKAYIRANAGALQHVGKNGLSVNMGTPGKGCLTKTSDESPGDLVGGTQTLSFIVDPGSLEIAGYSFSDQNCGGSPVIGPVTVEAATDAPIFVFGYGTTSEDAKLLVVKSS